MVVLVHKCAQQTHLLALHLETLGYIPRLLNALNGLVYFLIIGDPRGDNLMVGSISRKLLTELGIRTEDAECKLMGDCFSVFGPSAFLIVSEVIIFFLQEPFPATYPVNAMLSKSIRHVEGFSINPASGKNVSQSDKMILPMFYVQ